MKTMSQVASYEECFETLEEARTEIKRLRVQRDNELRESPAPSELSAPPLPTQGAERLREALGSLEEGRNKLLWLLGEYEKLHNLKFGHGHRFAWANKVTDRMWDGITLLRTALSALSALPTDQAKERKGGGPSDEWLEGYKARVGEEMTMRPEPTNPTLWRYLQNAYEKKVSYHRIGVNRQPDGGFHFYIHPEGVSGDTQDYLIWPDPFNWSDMLVNRLDSPPPDVEKFKAYLAKQFPSRPTEGTAKSGGATSPKGDTP